MFRKPQRYRTKIPNGVESGACFSAVGMVRIFQVICIPEFCGKSAHFQWASVKIRASELCRN